MREASSSSEKNKTVAKINKRKRATREGKFFPPRHRRKWPAKTVEVPTFCKTQMGRLAQCERSGLEIQGSRVRNQAAQTNFLLFLFQMDCDGSDDNSGEQNWDGEGYSGDDEGDGKGNNYGVVHFRRRKKRRQGVRTRAEGRDRGGDDGSGADIL